jgi:RimJ/RimL family protein N-acetyltransferase
VSTAPREVRIGGWLLRPWGADDAQAYADAVNVSHAHLRRFEGWAQRAPSLADAKAYIDWVGQSFERGSAFVYGVFDDPGGGVAGSVGLYTVPAQPELLTIGYWTHIDRINLGVATLAATAVTSIAFAQPSVLTVEAQCDVANEVSARIPKRLGFRLVDTRPRPRYAPEEVGRALIWQLGRSDYPRTYANRLWNEERR